ncbi:hypothetical protein BJD99_05870 [Rhodococcus sp. 1163]|uniref:hypothetical protein n=1 Tax=Rhodococcus sp. 1163 TaxID=1905289 RepID=UPI000A036937|nr:hypothetical protein [Rhodococcus sp. 1163]ORI15220.1 hypothetical protein BJD99_05870 [Rhodococcus sp. 1163]
MIEHRTAPRRFGLAAAVCAMVLLPVAPAHAVPLPGQLAGRTEIAFPANESDDGGVQASYVSFEDPLPAAAGQRPPQCDRLGYTRFRATAGPDNSEESASVFVTMPGYLEGAGSAEPLARNTVRAAGERGQYVEVWVLDRRANCLEDHRGLVAAADRQDPNLAFGYYGRGQEIEGVRYSPAASIDTAFLGTIGLKQTLEDQFTVMQQLSPNYRKTRTMCGGHSLGGLTTGAFANWDFDGTPGYDQCAGYFVLDSRMDVSDSTFAAVSGLVGSALPGNLAATVQPLNNALPYIPLSEATFTMLSSMLSAASIDPGAASTILPNIQQDLVAQLGARAVSAPNYLDFLLGQPDLRTRSYSNSAAVGLVLDDNSMPIGFGRVSIGSFDSPVAPKLFPLSYGSGAAFAGILGGNKSVAPAAGNSAVGWTAYDQVARTGSETVDGDVFTTRESEVTDISQFSRAWSNPVVDGLEWYFPTRLLTETLASNTGDRTGDLVNLRYDVTPRSKVIYVDAGETGFAAGLDSLGTTSVGAGTRVDAPGYNHLDLVTAAWNQNNGRPEVVSHSLIDFLNDRVISTD